MCGQWISRVTAQTRTNLICAEILWNRCDQATILKRTHRKFLISRAWTMLNLMMSSIDSIMLMRGHRLNLTMNCWESIMRGSKLNLIMPLWGLTMWGRWVMRHCRQGRRLPKVSLWNLRLLDMVRINAILIMMYSVTRIYLIHPLRLAEGRLSILNCRKSHQFLTSLVSPTRILQWSTTK